MAYSKQTWDTTSYVNPTRMNHIEQGIYDNSTDISNNAYHLKYTESGLKCQKCNSTHITTKNAGNHIDYLHSIIILTKLISFFLLYNCQPA